MGRERFELPKSIKTDGLQPPSVVRLDNDPRMALASRLLQERPAIHRVSDWLRKLSGYVAVVLPLKYGAPYRNRTRIRGLEDRCPIR